ERAARDRVPHRGDLRLGSVAAVAETETVDAALGLGLVGGDSLRHVDRRVAREGTAAESARSITTVWIVVVPGDADADRRDLLLEVGDQRALETALQVAQRAAHRAGRVHHEDDVDLVDLRAELEDVLLRIG